MEGARDAAGNLIENANLGERVGDAGEAIADRAGDLADRVDVGEIAENAGEAAGGLLERA